jgi:hypothetical protein
MPQAGLSESQLDEVWQETGYRRPRITGRVPVDRRVPAEAPRRRQREVASWWDGEVPVPVPVRAPRTSTRAAVARERRVAAGDREFAAADREFAAAERPRVAADAAPAGPARAPERRTVTITGRGADPYRNAPRRRPPRSARERVGFRPDRTAMWAVLLGVLLILVAATSSHAATRRVAARASVHAPAALHAAAAPQAHRPR